MTTEFTQLDLHPQLVQAVAELGYTTPTPIQSAIIPVMLTGQDVIGQNRGFFVANPAQSGRGPGPGAMSGVDPHPRIGDAGRQCHVRVRPDAGREGPARVWRPTL